MTTALPRAEARWRSTLSRGSRSQQAGRRFEYSYAEEEALAAKLDLDHPDPELMRRIFAKRRQRVLQAIPDGAMIVFSVEWVQPRRLEFQVDHSDNHDFIFLTGIEGLESVESALLLLPAEEKSWVVLYTSQDAARAREVTGIEDVRPYAELEQDLSVALTDYRDWRITQIRRWPLAAALSKRWGRDHKVLYFNYPRFFRVGMPEPSRLEFFDRLRRFSPELAIRDASDVLDPVRMLHDAYALASLRRAVEITGEGIAEAFRATQAGMTEAQVMQIADFVYRYRGGYLGFPTGVRRYPMAGRPAGPSIPEGFIQYVPRSGMEALQPGDMLHIDTGAAFNHYSADIQRDLPVGGRFNAEQRLLYEIALNVQKTVISRIRPGATWWELHRLAERMLREAGGYDRYWTYGIGHFIGMEVHDEGDYEGPLEAGMVLSIEQGVAPPDGPRVAFEDDVIVTDDGHEWISRSIPIEMAEIEALAREAGSFEGFVRKEPPGTR
ncbi:MAG: M24 family metallopeptidase [Gemmatimonadetes bacterium]|nr:M24 family metallopeptidase [Gemmatimonadota bacterium]